MRSFNCLISGLLLICCFYCEGRCQLAPEFSKVAAFVRQGKLDNPLYLVSDRLAFNDFLMNMPLPWVVQGRLSPEQINELRKLATGRAASLRKSIDEIGKEWAILSTQDRSAELARIEKEDEQSLKEMVKTLDELLSPSQKQTLAKMYMTNHGGQYSCADPILRNWVGLTEQEARQIRTRYEISSQFTVSKLKELNLSPLSRLPADVEAEFIRLQVLAWEGIDRDKMKRILVYSGLLQEEENLADYVERFPEVGEIMIKHLPVFAESVQNKRDSAEK